MNKMEFILVVVAAGVCLFSQACLGAPAERVNDSEGLNNDEFKEIRTFLKSIDGVKPQAVDELLILYSKLDEDTPPHVATNTLAELFVLALNSTYTKEQALSWIEHEIEADHKLADITDETLKIWENKLSKKLTPDQTTAAIKIMHGLRDGAKLTERDESLMALIFAAGVNKLYNSINSP